MLTLEHLRLENSEKHKPKSIPNSYTSAFSIQPLQSDFLTHFLITKVTCITEERYTQKGQSVIHPHIVSHFVPTLLFFFFCKNEIPPWIRFSDFIQMAWIFFSKGSEFFKQTSIAKQLVSFLFFHDPLSASSSYHLLTQAMCQ